jgi:hypothetical protein
MRTIKKGHYSLIAWNQRLAARPRAASLPARASAVAFRSTPSGQDSGTAAALTLSTKIAENLAVDEETILKVHEALADL